jgi:hypothetical protein
MFYIEQKNPMHHNFYYIPEEFFKLYKIFNNNHSKVESFTIYNILDVKEKH